MRWMLPSNDATSDLPVAFPFNTAFLDVIAGLRAEGHPGQGISVQCTVESPAAPRFNGSRTLSVTSSNK